MTCYHDISNDYLHCPICGEKQDRIICRCQHVNPSDANFCTLCGFELTNESQEVIQSTKHTLIYNLKEIFEIAKANQTNGEQVTTLENIKVNQDDIDKMFQRKPDHGSH